MYFAAGRAVAIFCMCGIALLTLGACSGVDTNNDTGDKYNYPVDTEEQRRLNRGRVTGEGGLRLFDSGDKGKSGQGSGIGVNSFLWRATLDTLSFMPLAQVDPHGGVIITDWYEHPDARGERFKINVLILGTELRTDGIRVSTFKQTRGALGDWEDTKPGANLNREMEDKILTRARELRIASSGS